MKYLSWILVSILFFPALALAATATDTSTPVIKDVLKIAPNMVISEPVSRDVLIMAGDIQINSSVAGDVLAAGGSIAINAPVGGDIRIAGGQITINSKVGGNVVVAGGQVSFGPMSEIVGNIEAWTGQTQIAGKVAGDVYVQTGKGVDLQIDPSAVIGGTLTYKAESVNTSFSAGTTAKEVVFQERPRRENDAAGAGYIFRLMSLFGMLVVGLVIVSVAPKALRRSMQESLNHPKKNIWWGLLALFATPVAIIFLFFTLIGIPLALILGAGYLMILYLATIFSGLILGDKILRYIKKGNSQNISLLWVMLLGVIVLWLIGLIPVVGWLITCLAVIWGVGMIINLKWQSIKQIED